MYYSAPNLACFLVEWYRPEATRRPLDETVAMLDAEITAIRAEGSAVELIMALTARSDQVLYSVFAASSSDTVRQACERAGLPPERVTGGIEARVMADEP
jgi:hypothetical protein